MSRHDSRNADMRWKGWETKWRECPRQSGRDNGQLTNRYNGRKRAGSRKSRKSKTKSL